MLVSVPSGVVTEILPVVAPTGTTALIEVLVTPLKEAVTPLNLTAEVPVKLVPLMVTVIIILEIAAGALSGIGCALIVLTRDSTLAFYGAVVAAAGITALFFGQRMAKDYAGAAVLVPYFLLTLSAIYLLAQR